VYFNRFFDFLPFIPKICAKYFFNQKNVCQSLEKAFPLLKMGRMLQVVSIVVLALSRNLKNMISLALCQAYQFGGEKKKT
jgi:hypothetical protein